MAACPLGFGGGKGGELTPYHCPLCRALLHEPVATSCCKRNACKYCIGPARDCPLCGADLKGTEPDAALGDTIAKLLTSHTKLLAKALGTAPAAPTPPAAAAAAGGPKEAQPPAPAPAASAAPAAAVPVDLPSMLLQLALQSLAGGNPQAALARLELCANMLCDSSPSQAAAAATSSTPADPAPPAAAPAPAPASAPPPGALGPDPAALERRVHAARSCPETASRLGAVLGSEADCCRRLSDHAAAQRLYAASLACLAPWAGRHRDVDQAIGVTHNKQGDLLYLMGQLPGALREYEAALEVRRRLVRGPGAGAGAPQGGPAAAGPQAGAAGSQAGPGGAAGAAGEGGGGAAVGREDAQDACDLATSLCKVADAHMGLCGGGAAAGGAGTSTGAGGVQAAGPGGGGGAGGADGAEGPPLDHRARAAALLEEAKELLSGHPALVGYVEGLGAVVRREGGSVAVAQRWQRVWSAVEALAGRLQELGV